MGMFGLILTLTMFVLFVVALFGWAIPAVTRHHDGTGTFFEPTGIWPVETDHDVEKYHCNRDECNGARVWEADRKTHNIYHDNKEFL